jgi:hypothetical protein
MKVGEFQKKLEVSSSSYSNFMGQNGAMKGMESDTFMGACEFFMKRELAGLKMPRAKKAKTASSSSGTADSNADKDDTNSKKKSAKKDNAADKHDVSSVHLDGENKHAVPIYDTCDDVRTKINRYLRETTGATNAGFVRIINSAAFPEGATSTPQTASARQLTTFLNGKGPVKGCESPVFYAAYVFFEKLRVKDGKPKTKKRTEMETIWKKRGMELVDVTTKGVFITAGKRPYVDKYGQLQGA